MTDTRRIERLDRLLDLVRSPGLPGMDGDAQAGPAALVDDVAVVREPKALDHRPGDVDPDHAPRSPADGLGGEDLVQLAAEGPVEAEDEPGLDLRVLEDRAVHARTAAAMMWSRSCSPPRLRFIGLKRSSRRVMLLRRYAPPMTSYTLRSTAMGLDWMSSVQ